MASKNFRIVDAEVRDDMGRYAQRYRQPAPPEITRRSVTEGTEVLTLLSQTRNQAMDHPSAGGKAGGPQTPWPAPVTPQLPYRFSS